jgi:hypothetical protein
MMIKLRPHHLLCTQGFSGSGYSDEFVENMTAVTDFLRATPCAIVEIVFSTDDICGKCPKKLGVDSCESNEKVKRTDSKVAEYFGVTEKSYAYHELVREINSKMSAEIMDDICGSCKWYPVSDCRKNILGEQADR